MPDAKSIIQCLTSSQKQIVEKLSDIVRSDMRYKYETFGKDIESPLVEIITDILISKKIIDDKSIIKPSSNKNEFPDMKISSTPVLAIEFKSGNHCKKEGSRWVSCSNSNNDLGTLNKWDEKLESFGGENIYYVFVEYAFSDERRDIVDVKIDPFYKFLDLNRDGVLKYRKKDGNLRPKNFDSTPKVTSLEMFQNLLNKTNIHRAKSLIEQYITMIPKDERDEYLETLKKI